MNCCNDYGQCNCSNGAPSERKAHLRSCDELGVCQERVSRCGGCLTKVDTTDMTATIAHGHAFAPGAVEAYKAPLFGNAAQRREWLRIVKAAAWWIGFCGLSGLAAGLIAGVW